MAGWVSARVALRRITPFSSDPKAWILSRARCGVPSRANVGMWRDGERLPDEPLLHPRFWDAMRTHGRLEVWHTGTFSYSVYGARYPGGDTRGEERIFEPDEKLFWTAHGVQFYLPDLLRQLGLSAAERKQREALAKASSQ